MTFHIHNEFQSPNPQLLHLDWSFKKSKKSVSKISSLLIDLGLTMHSYRLNVFLDVLNK